MSTSARVPVGKLGGVFGVRGEIKCVPSTLGEAVFVVGATFALGAEPDARELRCTGARRHHEKLLLAFEGIATPEDVRAFVGRTIYARAPNVTLAPGEYLDADLIGMRLVDATERELATVVAVQHFPAQDCLVVGPQRALVPMVKAFIRRVDLSTRTIVVDLPDGLLEG